MSTRYNRLLKVLENWPIDKSKAGRDLGEHLRGRLAEYHNIETIASPQPTENLTKQLASLERMSKNIYYTKYKRLHSSTATGLTVDQCNQVLSSQFLHYLNDDGK